MNSTPNYRRSPFTKLITAMLCVNLVITLLPPRAPAPVTPVEVVAATCVITLVCIQGVAMLMRECAPKASLYWYRVGDGPRIYVCLDCKAETAAKANFNFCQGPFGTTSYCYERAIEANTIWNGTDHCGPRADRPLRKKASLQKTNDSGKTWTEAKSVTANLDENPGFVVMFPGTVLDTNAFAGLTLAEQDIVMNPTNHVTVSDSAALFVMSSVIVDDSTNAPVSVKAYDANRMMKDGMLKP